MKQEVLGTISLKSLRSKQALILRTWRQFMKKFMITISMLLLSTLLTACGKDKNTEDISDNLTPTTQPTVTLPAEDTTEEDTDTTEDPTEETFILREYYPYQVDKEYVYEGEGNEYAAFVCNIDFIDIENNRIQTRTDNGGTVTVRVIELKDGKLSVVNILNEGYYRDNIMDATSSEEAEVLLMEPLVKGTTWTLPDGRKRFISETEVRIETPFGNYTTLEVTTEGTDSITKDYYAPQVGLVKSIFGSGDMEVTSTLSEINDETPFTQSIDAFYPDADEKIYVEHMTLTFHTGDLTKDILQEALRKETAKESYLPLISANTKINSLYLGVDNIVYVDFSAEFVQEMNAGSGYESLILQSVTNTLGNYYGVQKVNITLEGAPYESGHILMKSGETFEVNMDVVVR
jgi:hypothetical protein